MIGIVEYFSMDLLKVKCYLVKGSPKYSKIFDLVYEDSLWQVQKICNMSTMHREYLALHSLPKISFQNLLLNPAAEADTQQEHFEIPAKLNSVLQQRYNTSQFAAIKSSLKKSGVTLIQGPPGTGKTNTILGILSVLLNSKQESQVKVVTPTELTKEMLSVTQYSSDFKKSQYRKAMPWLSSGFKSWRDGDKSEITLPLEKHLVYPTSNITDR